MSSALKQQIADAKDIEQVVIGVPQWNVEIGVRSMDGEARARLMAAFGDEDGKVSYSVLYPELLINCTFDPSTGGPVFEDTAEDRHLIMSKSAGALDVVAKRAMEMSGLAEKSEEEVGKSS